MSPATSTLLNTVLALPEAERVAITEALLDSLPEDSVELDDDALEQELLRRSEELKNDPTASIPWSELKKMN